MFEESKLATEIGSFFTKISGYIAAIVFGLFGKIGMEIMMKKKYTWWQWTGIAMVSVFFGYTASVICDMHEWERLGMWLPSIATLLGQNIALYLAYNYKNIFGRILDIAEDLVTRRK
jgi:hypothetical protein